mmetsp:Transcript_29896/g.50247  ORF Transcript_29896/g.50247 Transcript_29896/m.50247 type:complete len:461 (+) Transcript_29896:6632-8014(+)
MPLAGGGGHACLGHVEDAVVVVEEALAVVHHKCVVLAVFALKGKQRGGHVALVAKQLAAAQVLVHRQQRPCPAAGHFRRGQIHHRGHDPCGHGVGAPTDALVHLASVNVVVAGAAESHLCELEGHDIEARDGPGGEQRELRLWHRRGCAGHGRAVIGDGGGGDEGDRVAYRAHRVGEHQRLLAVDTAHETHLLPLKECLLGITRVDAERLGVGDAARERGGFVCHSKGGGRHLALSAPVASGVERLGNVEALDGELAGHARLREAMDLELLGHVHTVDVVDGGRLPGDGHRDVLVLHGTAVDHTVVLLEFVIDHLVGRVDVLRELVEAVVREGVLRQPPGIHHVVRHELCVAHCAAVHLDFVHHAKEARAELHLRGTRGVEPGPGAAAAAAAKGELVRAVQVKGCAGPVDDHHHKVPHVDGARVCRGRLQRVGQHRLERAIEDNAGGFGATELQNKLAVG